MPRFILTESEKRRILGLYINEQGSADINIDRLNREQLKQAAQNEKPDLLKCVKYYEANGDTFSTYTNGKKFIRVYNPNSIQVFWETGAFQQFVRNSDKSAGKLTKSGTYACNAQKNDVVINAKDAATQGGAELPNVFRCLSKSYNENEGDNFGTWTNGKQYLRNYVKQESGDFTLTVYWEDGFYQWYETTGFKGNPGNLKETGNWSCSPTGEVVFSNEKPVESAQKSEWMTYLTDSVFNGKSKQYQKYKDQDAVYFPDYKTYYTEKEWFTVDNSGNVTKSGYWFQDKNKPQNSQFTQGEGKNPNEKTVTVAPPLENVAKGTASMKQGNQGDSVKTLQQMLIDKGYLKINNPTNYFGNMTYNAVLQFQKDNNLAKQDGVIGPETYAALYRAPEVQKTANVNIPSRGIQAQPLSSETPKAPTQITIPNR